MIIPCVGGPRDGAKVEYPEPLPVCISFPMIRYPLSEPLPTFSRAVYHLAKWRHPDGRTELRYRYDGRA